MSKEMGNLIINSKFKSQNWNQHFPNIN